RRTAAAAAAGDQEEHRAGRDAAGELGRDADRAADRRTVGFGGRRAARRRRPRRRLLGWGPLGTRPEDPREIGLLRRLVGVVGLDVAVARGEAGERGDERELSEHARNLRGTRRALPMWGQVVASRFRRLGALPMSENATRQERRPWQL